MKLTLQKLWHKTTKKDLIYLFLHGEEESTRKTALAFLRKRDDFTLDDIYELMISSEFPEDLWKMFLGLGATPEDCVEVIKDYSHFDGFAEKRIEVIMKNGEIKKGRSKRLLKRVFEDIPRKRVWAWKLLKPLALSNDELRKLLGLSFMNLPSDVQLLDIKIEIEKIIRKQSKKVNHGDRLTKRIENIVRKLKKQKNKEQ